MHAVCLQEQDEERSIGGIEENRREYNQIVLVVI
jgi:hypothetical protein